MKKLILVLSVAFVMAGSLSSCCKTCTQSGANSVQVCKSNYATEQDYTNAVSAYEFLGYTCN